MTAGVFNSSDQLLAFDAAGHMLEPGAFLSTEDAGGDLTVEPIAGHLKAERLVKVDHLPEDYEPRTAPAEDTPVEDEEPVEEPVKDASDEGAVEGDASADEDAESAKTDPQTEPPTAVAKRATTRKRTTQE